MEKFWKNGRTVPNRPTDGRGYLVLTSLDKLDEVAAGWPFATLMSVAIAHYPQVSDLPTAVTGAFRQFGTNQPHVVISYIEARDLVIEKRRAMKAKSQAQMARRRKVRR